jgi:2-keto-3-deoxy-L-rhamnonate aldolase RhmA
MLCATALSVGLLPLVRVPSVDPPLVTRVLDGGALGIIAPHVETPEEARALVEVCRFPPVGRRTLYGATPATRYRSAPHDELAAELDADVVVIAMIESETAVERAEEIAAVDGVDVLLVGAHDLSADLGVSGDVDHEAVRKAVRAVADACEGQNARLGVAGLTEPLFLTELAHRNLGLVSGGTDVGLLAVAAAERVTNLRGVLNKTKDRN